jgi:hypothetical protein
VKSTSRLLRRALIGTASVLMTVVVGGSCARAQSAPKTPKPLPAPALLLAPLAGQPIAVLPATYIITDGAVTGVPVGRAAQLAWVDSVVGEALQARGPEAHWMLPAEVRRVARRAPGIVTDPDQMGQATMRFEGFKKVPDPLFANIRSLSALTGSRFVMIPAAFRFSQTAAGVKVEATLVLTDARSGTIPWRSSPVATAVTAADALAAAIAWILPDAH